ncbi:MAG TPA: DUF2252 domain-containing protein [Acidimicrobiia bacterium]
MTVVEQHPTAEVRAEQGRTARSSVPRSSHGDWVAQPGRRSPVDILREQATTRVPELVPIRHARMTASPFAFYRGAAAVMAADLATTPVSGLQVQCCGDAHLANFGGFSAPDRSLVFDVNDFDETLPGPWEWDLKRLAASFEIAARARGFDERARLGIVNDLTRAYRQTMRTFASDRNLDPWYARMDGEEVRRRYESRVPAAAVRKFERNVARARARDSLRALAKLTTQVDGRVRIISDPPLVVPFEELMPSVDAEVLRAKLHGLYVSYQQTLQEDRRHLARQFQPVDFARKVVGVGSVGTECWIVLLRGRDDEDPLFLQIKQAEASVLEPYLGRSEYSHHGQRVVTGQRLMQSASDIFLGWDRVTADDGKAADYYVRQLWDGKFSADLDTMTLPIMQVYADMCGSVLARAHARSGDRIAIAAYVGKGDTLDRSIARFATVYADQNQRDFDEVTAAVKDGELQATPG